MTCQGCRAVCQAAAMPHLRLPCVQVGLDEDLAQTDVLADSSQGLLHGLTCSQDGHAGDLREGQDTCWVLPGHANPRSCVLMGSREQDSRLTRCLWKRFPSYIVPWGVSTVTDCRKGSTGSVGGARPLGLGAARRGDGDGAVPTPRSGPSPSAAGRTRHVRSAAASGAWSRR